MRVIIIDDSLNTNVEMSLFITADATKANKGKQHGDSSAVRIRLNY